MNQQTQEHLTMRYLTRNESGRIDSVGPVSDDYHNGITAYREKFRSIAFEYDSDDEGLDLAGIDNFLIKEGFTPTPCLILEPSRMSELVERFEQEGMTGVLDPGCNGQYLHNLDLIFVLRHRDLEKLNGPGVTEAVIVHEKIHASHDHKTLSVIEEPDETVIFLSGRVGQITMRLNEGYKESDGSFLEEALAEFMSGKYVSEQLGLHYGINNKSRTPWRTDQAGNKLPALYFWKASGGRRRQTYSSSAIAAYGLQLLTEAKPELLPALVSARHSVEGLRAVPKILNSIQPGLYASIRKLKYTPVDFSEGLAIIEAAIASSSSPDTDHKSFKTKLLGRLATSLQRNY